MSILRTILLCWLWMPLWCAAVQPYTPTIADPILEPWRWRHEEFLDGIGVLCMDEAPDGTLWFGTANGLAWYDGRELKEVVLDEKLLSRITQTPDSSRIPAILALPEGGVLALAGRSLVLFKAGSWSVVIQDVGGGTEKVRFAQSEEGDIAFTLSQAVWYRARGSEQFRKIKLSAGDHQFLSSCFGEPGSLWVVEQIAWDKVVLVHHSFMDQAKGNGTQIVSTPDGYRGFGVDIAMTADGSIAFATGQRETPLYLYSPREQSWRKVGEKDIPWSHERLLQSHDGSLWIGLNGRLQRLTPDGTLLDYPDLAFDVSPVFKDFYETSDHRLWIVGRGGEVCTVDLGFSEWLTYEGINFECEGKDGILWFSANDGRGSVFALDTRSDSWVRYDKKDGVVDWTRYLVCSSDGLIFALGAHDERAAFSVFDGTSWTRYCFPEFARKILPDSMYEASDGTLWIGAQGRQLDFSSRAGGALQFRVTDDRKVELIKHHSTEDGFPYYITAFAETPDGSMWLGSTLVHRVKPDGSIEKFPELKGDNVVAMALDDEKSLWIAKEYFGVCRWKNGVWETFDQDAGFSDLKFSDLVVLRDGSIVLSSSQEVSRFDGISWDIHVYPEWFSMSSQWSSMGLASEGRDLWFSFDGRERMKSVVIRAVGGICSVRHRMEKDPPDTRFVFSLEKVAPPGNMHVSWAGEDPDGRTPKDALKYSWRLDDGVWSDYSFDTSTTFLNLKSGKHSLAVRARDRAFNVDPAPARIEFEVTPAIWKQSWFILMVTGFVGVIGLLVWLMVRIRERHLVEQQAQREESLRKEQQAREHHLNEMDRLKTGFFTNISHELRTPMTVISGRLEMIFNSETDEKRRNALAIVLRNAQRVSTLVTQLLDFRKIEEGKIKVEATKGDLGPLLRDWVDSLQVLAAQKGIALSVNCEGECRGVFDFDKLEKVFTNLISNAIKYTPNDGKVEVRLKVEDSWVRFVVEDNGLGISQEHLPRIFDRFYRVSEASMAVGAGIGLNLTKELVDLLGGEISVESPIHPDEERPGTRFTVLLPLDAETVSKVECQKVKSLAPTESTPTTTSTPFAETHEDAPLILIVEDDEDIRNFIVEGLEPAYRVNMAKNGEIGLRMAKDEVPDLIVTDVMMPVMDGMTLCRELKAGLETSHIPVVMLTAKAALDSQLEGLKTGADDYVTKPFHMELLQARIVNLLESRRLLREQFCREYTVIAQQIPLDTPEKEFLGKAMRILEENYTDWEFSRDQFATRMGMSVSSLNRKMKAVADRNSSGFIQEYRMIKAAELLAGTSYTVTEIAFQVGFQSSSHFSRLFKETYNLSPSQYRLTK